MPPSSVPSRPSLLTLQQGLRNLVDLLTPAPLHQLKALSASHLPLPVYHNDIDSPFVHTLRHLRLRSTSIQWMSGRTFQVLETCTLIFLIHHHVLDTFCATLPKCKDSTFEVYSLHILNAVSANRLTHLSVVCSSSYKPRGNRQLARLCSEALRENRLAPRILHISISIDATNKAWTKALAFMSNPEELVVHNAQPSSLGVEVLQSLVVHPVRAYKLSITATPGKCNILLCPSLKRFGLRYRRWLRPSEYFDLIPVFKSIIQSREQANLSLHSFRIWTRVDQNDPLELTEGLLISLEEFEVLKGYAMIADLALATLARLPAPEILKFLGSNPVGTTGLPLRKADPHVTRTTNEFIDSIQRRPIAQQKKAVGDKLVKVMVKGVHRITNSLLDTEDLRALAHLMNSYPVVLKEKSLLQAPAAKQEEVYNYHNLFICFVLIQHRPQDSNGLLVPRNNRVVYRHHHPVSTIARKNRNH